MEVDVETNVRAEKFMIFSVAVLYPKYLA